MTEEHEMNGLEPDLDGVADRLSAERPIPRAGFRAELRSHLIDASHRRPAPPRRLRTLITAYALSGATLLAVVAAGVAGVGPLAG
jgi:hypothetical protein